MKDVSHSDSTLRASVNIRTSKGSFLAVEDTAVTTASSVVLPQTWRLIALDNGRHMIQACNGQYLSVDVDGAVCLTPDADDNCNGFSLSPAGYSGAEVNDKSLDEALATIGGIAKTISEEQSPVDTMIRDPKEQRRFPALDVPAGTNPIHPDDDTLVDDTFGPHEFKMTHRQAGKILRLCNEDESYNHIFLAYAAFTWTKMARVVLNNRLQPGVFKNGKAIPLGSCFVGPFRWLMTRDYVTSHISHSTTYVTRDCNRLPNLNYVYRFDFDKTHWNRGFPRLGTDQCWFLRESNLESTVDRFGELVPGSRVESFYTMLQFSICRESGRVTYDFEQESHRALDGHWIRA